VKVIVFLTGTIAVALSHSQSLRHISVANKEDEEPTHVGGVLDVDSNHIMEPSDDKGTTGTTDKPI
jgi:hypothetical protein